MPVRTFALVLVALSPAIARADAIMGPPDDCPPGTLPMSSHAGPWCEDTTCATDADCDDDRIGYERAPTECRLVSLCVPPGTRATGPGGYDTPRGYTPAPGRDVRRACADGSACADGTICEQARRCVARSLRLADEAPRAAASSEGTNDDRATSAADRSGGSTEPARTTPPGARAGCSIAADRRGGTVALVAFAGLVAASSAVRSRRRS